jgi:regulator of sirC expression with transglutaminase-like and TPR domain
MLNNLKQVYLRNGELTRAGTVIEQMLVVSPESNGERRNLGMLALHQNQYSQGISWLLDYLERAPNAPDVEAVRQAIQHAAERRARLN